MKRKFPAAVLILCSMGMVCLILDSQCATESVKEAIRLCQETVVPSLFPLFVLSGVMVSILRGVRMSWLRKFIKLPEGCEGIFLLGLVGGYPLGAQCIVQAAQQRALSKTDAQRMLGFCNNCGPAFIFGILGGVLSGIIPALAVFLIQMESAIVIGMLWPGEASSAQGLSEDKISLPKAVAQAVRSMVSICAWVILARILLGFLRRWLFPFLPPWLCTVVAGLLEVTSGCLSLNSLSNDALTFILACGFVCFGGVSVMLQIHGLTDGIGLKCGTCVAQKTVQAGLAMLIAAIFTIIGWPAMIFPLPAAYLLKLMVENSGILLYNSPNKGGI